MHAFFHGWRRKAGVVTLMMACVLMLHWFRSQLIADVINNDASQCILATGGGALIWSRRESRLESSGERGWICGGVIDDRWGWESKPYKRDDLEPAATFNFSTRYSILGAEISVATRQGRVFDFTKFDSFSLWKLSLLWLVIPLTILSASLILWKPRK
jgi:hypothetical protein